YLHDRGAGGFPLFLVGGEQCADTLKSDPQLADRVGNWVEFAPLKGDELHRVLASYHPLLANSDRALLDQIDATYARGRFRRWAAFLKQALPLATKSGTDQVTIKIAKATLSVLPLEGSSE